MYSILFYSPSCCGKTVVNVIPLVCFSLCLEEGVIHFDKQIKHPNFKMLFARYGRDWSGDSWEDNIYKLYNKEDDSAVMPINIPCTAKRKTTNSNSAQVS